MSEQQSETPVEESVEEPPKISGALRVTSDRMTALFEGIIPSDQYLPIAEVICNRLVEMEIHEPPPPDVVARILQKAYDNDPEGNEVLLVEGVEPVEGEDGHIEWAADFFNEGFSLDEKSDSLDYHEPAAQLSVLQGDQLAVMIPMKKGEDGFDVFGTRIPAVVTTDPRIRSGDNVEYDKETRCYSAKTDGRFKWANHVLSVDEIYYVRGDVGPETGNISHPGMVTVTGDVLEGFKLETSGDIAVNGIVEGAHIQTTGKLSVRGGIIGAENQRIVGGDDIHARFIVDADLVAEGDVSADSEIVQTAVHCRGSVQIPRGRIVGGTIMALGGIVAGAIGNSSGIPTTIIAGSDYSLEGQILIKEMEISRMRKTIDSYLERPPKETAKMEEALAAAQVEVEEIRKDSARRKHPEIDILKAIHPDTTLCIEDYTLSITEKIRGPVTVKIVEEEIQIVRPGS